MICCLQETLTTKDTHELEVKGWKKIPSMHNSNASRIPIFIWETDSKQNSEEIKKVTTD
jgi:hypothetical protein